MATLQSFSFNTPAENMFGYTQAVKAGDMIYVSGQLSHDEEGNFLYPDDVEAQAKQTFANLDKVLAHFGASRKQIVQDSVFVVDLHKHAASVSAAHLEYFGDHRPSSTALSVDGLFFPGQNFEINAVVDTRLDA